MMKSNTYGAQGIMDFMGIVKSVFPVHIPRLQDAGKSAHPKKFLLF
jgi:hypothetical protein